jgi:hypothetical protein
MLGRQMTWASSAAHRPKNLCYLRSISISHDPTLYSSALMLSVPSLAHQANRSGFIAYCKSLRPGPTIIATNEGPHPPASADPLHFAMGPEDLESRHKKKNTFCKDITLERLAAELIADLISLGIPVGT